MEEQQGQAAPPPGVPQPQQPPMQHEHGQLDAFVPGGPLVAVQQAAPPLRVGFWDTVHDERRRRRAARLAAILAAVGIVILPVGQGEAG